LGTSPHFTTIVVEEVAFASTPIGPKDGTEITHIIKEKKKKEWGRGTRSSL
jgi:hypothetical protein